MAGSLPAAAADLGGNCCADLEERIAELEATTARKGNRKVSLTISGWVNEAVFFWDDGTERNVYVGTNNLEQSRFKFSGDAKIDKDWSAGYVIEIGLWGADSSRWNANGPSDQTVSPTVASHDAGLQVRKSAWWIKSKQLGKITVGREGTATYHLLDDADGANTRNYSDAEAASVAQGVFRLKSGGFDVLGGATPIQWNNVERGFNNGTPGQSGRRNVVRYDSPEFSGFVITAAWGEDDLWDAALTYKGEIGDFKLVAKAGYGESTDEASTGTSCGGSATGFKCKWWGAAGTAMHKPTGLYLYGGYGQQKIDTPSFVLDDTSTTWFLQPGIEQKWLPLGKTTIFGEYRHDEPGSNNSTSRGADLDFWAGGVVQNIEAAAMDLYVIYRHADGDFTANTALNGGAIAAGSKVNLDSFDMIITGARIQF
jgi:predicted outer membrane repeat protein